jgi:hypothetical protein
MKHLRGFQEPCLPTYASTTTKSSNEVEKYAVMELIGSGELCENDGRYIHRWRRVDALGELGRCVIATSAVASHGGAAPCARHSPVDRPRDE